jgi:hypothetical protein
MQNWFGARNHNGVAGPDALARVRVATSAAICRVNLESVDLRERIDNLGCQLASALGDLDGIYYEREPEDEKTVSILERRYLEVVKRSKNVGRQLAVLQGIEKLLYDQ